MIDGGEPTGGCGYSSDRDLEDGDDEKTFLSKHTINSEACPFDQYGNDKVDCEGHEERAEKGRG